MNFIEGDSLPDDEAAITDGLIDEDGIEGAPVEHGDEPTALVLSGDGRESGGGGFGEDEGGSESAIFSGERRKALDVLGDDLGAAAEEYFLSVDREREDHLGPFFFLALHVERESDGIRLFPHGMKQGRERGEKKKRQEATHAELWERVWLV